MCGLTRIRSGGSLLAGSPSAPGRPPGPCRRRGRERFRSGTEARSAPARGSIWTLGSLGAFFQTCVGGGRSAARRLSRTSEFRRLQNAALALRPNACPPALFRFLKLTCSRYIAAQVGAVRAVCGHPSPRTGPPFSLHACRRGGAQTCVVHTPDRTAHSSRSHRAARCVLVPNGAVSTHGRSIHPDG